MHRAMQFQLLHDGVDIACRTTYWFVYIVVYHYHEIHVTASICQFDVVCRRITSNVAAYLSFALIQRVSTGLSRILIW